ncbi:MAG: hypothetical protein HFK03_04445 [Clostridia bacterium]|jgi:hypothetical protein|nr:hypothetical protein [Clostridia bacterium]
MASRTTAKKQSGNFGARLVAVFMAILLIVGLICAAGYGSKNAAGQWFKNGDITTWFNSWGKGTKEPDETKKPEESSFLVRAQYTEGDLATFAATPYVDNGNSVYLTLLTEPVETDDTFTWSSSDTSIVTVTPSDNGRSATVTCMQAFSEQITVKAVSNETGLEAVATCDYVKRLQSVTMSMSPEVIKFGNVSTTHTVTLSPVWGVGTITPELTITETVLSSNKRLAATESDDTNDYFYVTFDHKSFAGGTFDISDSTSVGGGFNNVYNDSYIPYATAELNKAIKNYATGTTSDGKITAKYTVTYKGKTYTSSEVTKGVGFDITNLKSYASSITPDKPGIEF